MAKLRDVIEGLQILAKYSGPDKHDVAAEHDEIYAGPSLDDDEIEIDPEDAGENKYIGSRFSADDVGRLRELGWFIDGKNLSWMRFV